MKFCLVLVEQQIDKPLYFQRVVFRNSQNPVFEISFDFEESHELILGHQQLVHLMED